MPRRFVLPLVLALSLTVALLAAPVMAHALEVTGTVTAAGTGDPLEGVDVGGAYWTDTNSWGITSDKTDANGEYSLTLSPGETVTCQLHATDATGTYDAGVSSSLTINIGEDRRVDFELNRDTRKPLVNLYVSSSQGFRYASRMSIAALPPGFEHYGVMTDGKGVVGIDAEDEWYRSHRYWGWLDGSGIKHVGYGVNGGAWSMITPANALYTDWWQDRAMWLRHEFPMPPEGINSLATYAVDNNGNSSGIRSMLVVVDKTSPATTYNRRTATTKTIRLVASDALTGVAGTFIRTGGTGSFTYGTTVAVPSSGSKDVQFYSTDKVGNIEAVRKLKVSSPAALSKPVSSAGSVRAKTSFTVSGKVYRRSSARGYVHVYKLVNGRYKHLSKKAFAEGSNGRYKVAFKLGRGTYRFRATYGSYSSAWANPPVRSALSAKVHVY